MREHRVCPSCGIGRYGICPFCYPQAAERERQQELAADLAAEEDRARRDAGMLLCAEHDRHDGCWEFRRPEPEQRTLGWEAAWRQLWERYVP